MNENLFTIEISQTTDGACRMFSALYQSGYFRKRHRREMKRESIHKDLPFFLPGEQLTEYYNGDNGEENTRTLRDNLAGVDRRAFYRHVIKEIAGDGNVYNAVRWVSQNISAGNHYPVYAEGNPSTQVKDGIEILFIGYGGCGQINRLLGFLLKYGMGHEVNLVSTPGHAFVVWHPNGGDATILDSDFFRNGNIDLSISDLIDGKSASNLECNYHQIELSSAYVQGSPGDATYTYNLLQLTDDGTRLLEDVSLVAVPQPTRNYVSGGHRKISFSQTRLFNVTDARFEVDYKATNIEEKSMALYVWITNAPHGGCWNREEMATGEWQNHVVRCVRVPIDTNQKTRSILTKGKLPTNTDYFMVLAVSTGLGLWGFHVSDPAGNCWTFV